ncbi:RNA polymerase sigma factor [Parapedobacter koreensis]|uniref:RNA polymerase sigma-70 factor, ECF subfamily n=1 Tax=Parapedobacter koreensis TaxID=332977 RepID=A0A1H7PI56_9SPHI|nr:RNA polymerase sigma-70 factor [Parapedobacter koreensis]SEL35306.1 RNA polymerase sigma-70 factor, ECF subfamily [Parapedobacter koreensis]
MEDLSRYTDYELIELLKAGSECAFDEIYDRHWSSLSHHAYQLLVDEDDCQDVLQDVFMTLWKKAPTLSLTNSLAAYLHALVRNRILNMLARDKVRAAYLNQLYHEGDTIAMTVDEQLLEKELTQIITEEVDRMPEKMRAVYRLSREQQLSQHEISSKLDISISTVKFHLNSALKRLKKRIEP